MAPPRLKEQLPNAPATTAWIHPRFAPPAPVTAQERICAALKNIAALLFFATGVTAAFLTVPLRDWDRHDEWQAIRTPLARLASQPDSAADMQQVYDAATAADILWNQPSGSYPTKWHPLQRKHYDAAYGTVQTIILGTVKQGKASQGFNELSRLWHRADSASVPNLPDTAHFKPAYAACPACAGNGKTVLDRRQFPLTATLRKTMHTREIGGKPMARSCPSCQGTGEQPTEISRRNSITRLSASAPGLFKDSVKGTLKNIDQGLAFWQPIHTLANAQRFILTSIGLSAAPRPQTHGSIAPASAPFAHVRAAGEALLASPLNEQNAQVIADTAKAETNPPELRNLSMSAFGISLLMRSNTGNYARVCAIQRNTFAEPYPAPMFTEGDYIANCKDCAGKGQRPFPCPSCMGPAACKTCGGKGQTTALDGTVPCPACKNAPVCLRCKGKKTVPATCTTCKGAKKTFRPSDRVRAAYGDVLTNLIAYCDSVAIAASPDEASSPSAPSRNGLLIPILILIGTTLPVIILIRLTLKRKRARRFSSLPGMENIDTDRFTDPLSLSAQERRNQVKRKTARIPFPDKSRD